MTEPLISYTSAQRDHIRARYTGLSPQMLDELSRFVERHREIWTDDSYTFLRTLLDGEIAKTQEKIF
jgi:hypothetical protein